MSNYTDYGSIFCDSVDTIIKSRLEGISFDKTEIYTIMDNTQKDQGIYQVGNDSIEFEAYSPIEVSYNKGDSVYVKIPKGDWNEQKIITGKKINKNTTPINYKSPFDYYLDITSNMASNITKNFGLTANKPDLAQILVWSWKTDENNDPLMGYTRLGLYGSFQSWLDSYKTISGDYGLRILITAIEDSPQVEDSSVDNKNQDTAKQVAYELLLNINDFYGNPYNFETFFQQEKVFDISTISKIIGIDVFFYQIPGSFKDKDGNEIPYKNDISFMDSEVPPNLFFKNLYIGLGYDSAEFQQEGVIIYTLNSKLYTPTPQSDEKNFKKIQLRWIHLDQDSNSFKSITLNDELDYEIRWYRYSLGARSADEYCGPHWASLGIEKHSGKNVSYTINDNDWNLKSVDYPFQSFSSWLFPDVTLQTEQIKAIVVYDQLPIRSNILTFENKQEVVSKPTIDAMQALELYCNDETNGNYLIYTPGNVLLESAESSIVRKLTATFKLSTDLYRGNLEIAEEIKWYIPNSNTMLVFDTNNSQLKNSIKTVEGNYDVYTCKGLGDTGNILIDSTQNICYNYINYRIKGYYTASNINNSIKCEVVKNKTKYTYVKEFSFGQAGTTGTDFTFVLDFTEGKTGIPLGNKSIEVVAQLYDYNNKLVNIDDSSINWTILNNNNCLAIRNGSTNKNNQKEIALLVNSFSNIQAPILQATLKDFGDYDLIAYLSLPIKKNDNYNYILGAINIWYDSMGSPTYYRNPYEIYYNGNLLNDIKWEIKNFTDKENYSHSLDNKNRLQALNFYIEDVCKNIAIIAKDNGGNIIWQQAIISTQNKYPSSTLNKWDGSLEINEKKNYILSAQIAAGRKNKDDNTFSGVMLGAWDDKENENSITSTTGLYGFYHGEMSYGLKDDGTAFIGRSGAGRITFDGDGGVISSNSYDITNGKSGMRINLSTGTIDAHDFTLSVGNYKTDNSIIITTDKNSIPLSVGSKFYVEWDGTIHATSGIFSGKITSKEGTIGGWIINETQLKSEDENVYLDSSSDTIHGAIIEAGTLSSNNTKNNLITLDGYLKVGDFGKLGYFESNMDNNNRPGIGMDYGSGIAAVKATEANAGMSYNVANYVSVEDSLVKVGAENRISLVLKNGKNQWSISQKSGIHLSVPDSGTIYMHGGTLDCSGIDDFIGVYARFK